ncbi:hypothetical protein ACJX0J_038409, partial [Zea mays]
AFNYKSTCIKFFKSLDLGKLYIHLEYDYYHINIWIWSTILGTRYSTMEITLMEHKYRVHYKLYWHGHIKTAISKKGRGFRLSFVYDRSTHIFVIVIIFYLTSSIKFGTNLYSKKEIWAILHYRAGAIFSIADQLGFAASLTCVFMGMFIG